MPQWAVLQVRAVFQHLQSFSIPTEVIQLLETSGANIEIFSITICVHVNSLVPEYLFYTLFKRKYNKFSVTFSLIFFFK